MSSKGFPPVAEFLPDANEHRRQIARAVNGLLRGRLNAVLDVTLTASATSTTITDPRISAFSVILWMPKTANAATAAANLYVTDRKSGSAVLNHASSADTDQDFTLLIIG